MPNRLYDTKGPWPPFIRTIIEAPAWHFGASPKDLGKEVSLIGQMDGTERQQLLDFFDTHWAPAQVV